MSFNLLLLLIFLFVIIPTLIRKYSFNSSENNLEKWPDMLTILTSFEKIPQIKLNLHFLFAISFVLFTFCLYLVKDSEVGFLLTFLIMIGILLSLIGSFSFPKDPWSKLFTVTNYHISLFCALFFIYLSHTMSSAILELLSLLSFAYIAHYYKDELFDTFWNSIITLFAFFLIFNLFSSVIHFVFIETDWNIVWRNRRTLLVGPTFVDPATGHQIWRLWPPFYFLMAIIGAAYGTIGEKKSSFFIPLFILSIFWIAFLWQEEQYYSGFTDATITTRNYNPVDATLLSLGGFGLAAIIFNLVHTKFKDAEEYEINYFQNILVSLTLIAFIATVLILDPPGDEESDYFWNSEERLGTGVKPAGWGGLFLNLIFASAAIVVGFGLGICLAFGRRSELPVFWVPSVAIIELVRSGPLVAWLFFAQILVPDILNPVWEADIASRIILVLSLFFGCYLSEVLRGGLQAVPYGQYEASTALGLSPMQTKLQIELPQAIRTTLPAIVSMMIGMLKDTSLVFFFGIYDAFRVAQDLPAQPDFLGQHEQPLLFVALLFWLLSFYLSRVSKRIEKNLGLKHEGGGDVT